MSDLIVGIIILVAFMATGVSSLAFGVAVFGSRRQP